MAGTPLEELKAIRGLVIDMDGVLWRGDTALPGITKFFARLREKDMRFILATNNNTQLPQGFVDKATAMGVQVTVNEVVNAGMATVAYLKAHYPAGTPVYVVSEPPVKQLITEAGFVLAESNVAVVVATMDRKLTYDMLKRATLLIRAGAEFIGTNPDRSYPTAEGIVPAAGAVIAAIEAATDQKARMMGKPQAPLFDISLQRMGLRPDQVASLGDRLDTDIEGGLRAGLKAILVLSGVTTAEEAAASPIKPTWTFSGIDELADHL